MKRCLTISSGVAATNFLRILSNIYLRPFSVLYLNSLSGNANSFIEQNFDLLQIAELFNFTSKLEKAVVSPKDAFLQNELWHKDSLNTWEFFRI